MGLAKVHILQGEEEACAKILKQACVWTVPGHQPVNEDGESKQGALSRRQGLIVSKGIMD